MKFELPIVETPDTRRIRVDGGGNVKLGAAMLTHAFLLGSSVEPSITTAFPNRLPMVVILGMGEVPEDGELG